MRAFTLDKAPTWREQLPFAIGVLTLRFIVGITAMLKDYAITDALDCYLLMDALCCFSLGTTSGFFRIVNLCFQRRFCLLLILAPLPFIYPPLNAPACLRTLLLACVSVMIRIHVVPTTKPDFLPTGQSSPMDHPSGSPGDSPTDANLRKPRQRREFFSTLLAEDEKWLDMLDKGYIVCRRGGTLVYANQTAQKLLRSLEVSFEQLVDKLVDQEDKTKNLRSILEGHLENAREGTGVKTQLTSLAAKQSNADTATSPVKASLFDHYTATIWKLRFNNALIIIKSKAHPTSIMAEKFGNVAHGTLVHELKTLLTIVVMNLELMADVLEEEHSQAYKQAWSSCKILDSRLNDLFDYAQIQRKQLRLHVIEFKVDGMIEELARVFDSQAAVKGLKFQPNKAPGLPETLLGDAGRIQQVLVNLLCKAIEYTDRGVISLRIAPKSGQRVCFKVSSQCITMQIRLKDNIEHTSPTRRQRRYTMDPSAKATQNMEEMSLEISDAICHAMGTKIIVKPRDNGESYLKFILLNGFPQEAGSGNPISDLQRPRKYSKQHERQDEKCQLDRTVYAREPDPVVGRVVNCSSIQNVNIINLNVPYGRLGKSTKSLFAPLHVRRDSCSDVEDVPDEMPSPQRFKLKFNEDEPKFFESQRRLSYSPPHLPSWTQLLSHSPVEKKTPGFGFDSLSPKKAVSFQQDYIPETKEELKAEPSLGAHGHLDSSDSHGGSGGKLPLHPGQGRPRKVRRDTVQQRPALPLGETFKRKALDDVASCGVLIVDDNENIRTGIKVTLAKKGHGSIEAEDGVEAVRLVKTHIRKGTLHNIKLILMDMQMPKMDGIEATETINKICEKAGLVPPPIVGISCNRSEENIQNFEKAGVKEFHPKPIDSQRLSSLLQKYVDNSQTV